MPLSTLRAKITRGWWNLALKTFGVTMNPPDSLTPFRVRPTEFPFWARLLPRFLQIHPGMSGSVIFVLSRITLHRFKGLMSYPSGPFYFKYEKKSGRIDIFFILNYQWHQSGTDVPSTFRFWTSCFNVTVLSRPPFPGSLIASIENTLTLHSFLIMNKTAIQTLRNFYGL